MNERLNKRIDEYKNKIGLSDCEVVLDEMPSHLVSEETSDGEYRWFSEGVMGVDLDPELVSKRIIRIVHSYEPQGADLIHEFLHFKHPDWSEEKVVQKTDEILKEEI